MRRQYNPIGQQLETAFWTARTACVAYDILSERPSRCYDKELKKFVRLLVYCSDHKLYAVRDRALKKILRDLES